VVGLHKAMQDDFGSPDAKAAVSDVGEFAAQTLIVTGETVLTGRAFQSQIST